MLEKKTWLNLIILGLITALLIQVGVGLISSLSKTALAISSIDESTINRPAENTMVKTPSVSSPPNDASSTIEEPGKIIKDLYEEISPIFIESGKALWNESKKIWEDATAE